MNADTLLSSLSVGEETDLELKWARGGVPGSMWETYSSMANTDGGCNVLGVENNGTISGLPDPAKARKTVWDLLDNRGQVSVNLLSNDQVRVVPVGEKSVLVMEIPGRTDASGPCTSARTRSRAPTGATSRVTISATPKKSGGCWRISRGAR